ncbi:MAG: RNA methyltransferase [Candidatus Caenarcaniphilales bacterium]|jgi:tRNA (guanosine-2'-O-)-methyltransferase|nr:RNA methyltransferase [Candidatus Caenarcaniphilales bacterium]
MTPERLSKIQEAVSKRQQGILVLEDIHDPHNAQAVIRSCDCFGVQKVFVIFDKEKTFDPVGFNKLCSSSANKWLDYEIFSSTNDCYQRLKELGYFIYATALESNSRSIYQIDFCAHKQVAIVLGNEHTGLSKFAIENADQVLMIPLHGMVQSLNLSVTAAICLFEMTRQRQKNFADFKLSKEEQNHLLDSFSDR